MEQFQQEKNSSSPLRLLTGEKRQEAFKENKKAKENFENIEGNNVMVQMRRKLDELQKNSYGMEAREENRP